MTGGCRGGYFQLQTLWLEHGHDIGGIVADLPNLKFLGIFYVEINKRFWKKIKGLFQNASSPLTMPAIVLLERFRHTLEIFPSSHHLRQLLTECREIGISLGDYTKADCDLTIDLLGIQEESISEIMERIAVNFQVHCPSLSIRYLEFRIHDKTIQVCFLSSK